ncbi:MAG: TatD DNase family protein [Flavobacteriales bacterium]|jgi:TatD DNase family protein
MLVDSHCHLDRINLDKYSNGLDDAVLAAKERGVDAMLCVCISDENRQAVIDIAERYDSIYASVGVHPCDIGAEVQSTDSLKEWVRSSSKVVALGETGLDYHYSKDREIEQKQSFSHHLMVAGELKLPVIVHTRDAREDTLSLIKEFGNTESSGVLHCFTESWDMAEKALDLNYYISLSGIITFKNAHELRDVAKKVPLDRLLIETDSPYLAPMPYRGKPNEPKYVREVAEYLAELRGISLEELAAITSKNFYRLFSRAG